MEFEKAIKGFIISITADGFSPDTIATYRWALSKLCDHLGNPEVNKISESMIKETFVWLRTDYVPRRKNLETGPLTGRSLENIWTAMRSFFNWAELEFEIKRPDKTIARPRYAKREVEPFTHDEIRRLLSACEKTVTREGKRPSFTMKRHTSLRDACLVMFLLDTGLRVSECARLNVGDIDLETGAVTVKPFRTGQKTKGRVVYFGKTTKKTLWKYAIDRYDNEPLFKTVDDKRMDRNSIRCMLNDLGKNANVPGCHPHRFRHTFAIEYLRAGGDVFTLQRLLGHSSLEMVQNYLALVPGDIARAYRSPSDIALSK